MPRKGGNKAAEKKASENKAPEKSATDFLKDSGKLGILTRAKQTQVKFRNSTKILFFFQHAADLNSPYNLKKHKAILRDKKLSEANK